MSKETFTVYLSHPIIAHIKREAERQHRKISAQTELYLAAAIKMEGESSGNTEELRDSLPNNNDRD